MPNKTEEYELHQKSVRQERAACSGTMQITKGLGISNKHFCKAKMAFVQTDALLAQAVTIHKDNGIFLFKGTENNLKCWNFHKNIA